MTDDHTSSIYSIPVRPFAPDDFRREKRFTPTPPSGTTCKTPTRAAPPIAPSTKPQDGDSEDVFFNSSGRNSHSSLSFQSRGTMSLDLESSFKNTFNPSVLTQIPTGDSYEDMREEAEGEWHSMRQRRQSLGYLPSHSKASLSKLAIMPESELLQVLDPPVSRPSTNNGTCFSGYSSAPTTPHFQKQRDHNINHKGLHNSSSSTSSRNQIETLPRARSIVSLSSSRISCGGDSTRGLLQDSSSGEMPLLCSDGELTDTPSRKELFVRGISHRSPTTPRLLETSNELTNDEKMDQLRRSQKLASMLGEDWRREREGDWLETSNYSSPLKGITFKKDVLLRRQSDPLHLYPSSQDRASCRLDETSDDERKTSRALMTPRWKPAHSKQRSRSSIDLKQDFSSPPLGIHPKAAILLGLCVFPNGNSNSDLALIKQQADDPMASRGRYDSYSSVEMLKDSDSIMGVDDITEEDSFGRNTELDGKSRTASFASSTAASEDTDYSSTLREERRRRVKKISKWLGAAVPPHLISPHLDSGFAHQRTASGYNLDEAPTVPFIDYMSGSPINPLDKNRRFSDGLLNNSNGSGPLIKAKAAVNAKLNKMVHPSSNERISHLFAPLLEQQSVMANKATLSERERQDNIKRNLKLTSVLGEAPPKDLLIIPTLSSSNCQRLTSQKATQGQTLTKITRSISPSARTPISSPSFEHFTDEEVVYKQQSTLLRDEHNSQQYRVSIDSLGYLLDKNPPLLDELVQAFEEDESYHHHKDEAHTTIADDPSYETFHDCLSEMSTVFASSRTSSEDQTHPEKGEEEKRARESRIRSHQKLGRWFGEALPSCDDKRQVEVDLLLPKSPAICEIVYPETPVRESNNNSRMAPRSAGSAQRAQSLSQKQALRTILNSIQDELTDDDLLSLEEKKNLQQRILRLQRGNVEAYTA